MATDILYLAWAQQHETGVAIFDEQQKAMLGVINSLFYSISVSKGMIMLKPTLKALEEMSHIHLLTVRSLSDETEFKEFCENAVFQYELLQEAKNTAREVRCEQDILFIVRLLKDWWMNFHTKQAA